MTCIGYFLPYIDMLPVFHSEFPRGTQSIKIYTPFGVAYFSNIQKEYRHDQRSKVIQYFSQFISRQPSLRSDAYTGLLWFLFEDYLNAFHIPFISKRQANTLISKTLYILRNSQGFIKIGIAKNIKVRIIDLKYEFGGDWEIIGVFENKGHLEHIFHQELMPYLAGVKHRHTGKVSTECFYDIPEVIEKVNVLVNKIDILKPKHYS